MVIIVDYDAGNLRSVQRACEEVGIAATISADPEYVIRADRVIFPGVGSAESAVDTLRDRGLDEALRTFYASGRPLLGICLGLQIALESTAEGDQACLGLLPGHCNRFHFDAHEFKVPQIGWNSVELLRDHPMLAATRTGDEFYFVHSYHASADNPHVLGVTEYGGTRFASIIAHQNFFATQFHLEKSGRLGLKLLSQFKNWQGDAPC